MDKPLVGTMYKTANGKQICIDVSIEVKNLLEQTDRQIRSQRRQDRRYLDFVESVDELDTLPTLPQEDTVTLVIKMDSCKRLYTAIYKLPEMQRRRLILYYFEGLTYRHIAQLEGVGVGRIAGAMKRALNTLGKLYDK